MSMMNSMMEKGMGMMMGRMSREDKEEMMLKMMPRMMQDIDMVQLMPRMMAEMIPVMVPLLFDELMKMKEKMERDGREFSDLFVQVAGFVMPKVFQLVDLDKMEIAKDAMMHKMMEHEELRKVMPQVKKMMMPGCLQSMLSALSEEDRKEFVGRMMSILIEDGSPELPDALGKELLAEFKPS